MSSTHAENNATGPVPCVCFSHGKESGPWGTKISALAKVAEAAGWSVESIDYRGIKDPHERVVRLLEWCEQHEGPLALAGSSMGGHVALAAASRLTPLGVFVMAPALFVPGYEQWTPEQPACPVTIVHGWHDEVIPWENSLRFAQSGSATLTLVDSDHGLASVLPELEYGFRLFLNGLAV